MATTRNRLPERPPTAAPARGTAPASAQASAIDWLRAEPAFREVASRLAGQVELQAMLAASYPQAPLVVLTLSDGTLSVAARNAADAARLRQLEPTVIANLKRRGAGVERLRIRTRRNTDDSASAPRFTPRTPIPATALDGFAQLEGEAQSDTLRRAIAQLLRHQRRRN